MFEEECMIIFAFVSCWHLDEIKEEKYKNIDLNIAQTSETK